MNSRSKAPKITYGLWQFGKGTAYKTKRAPHQATENSILNRAVDKLKAKYKDQCIFIRKIHGGGMQRSGIPDLYIMLAGKSIWIEFKRPGCDTTEIQKYCLECLRDAGAYCGTAESVFTAENIISEVLYSA